MSIIRGENNDYPTYILKNQISIIRYNDSMYIIKDKINKPINNKVWDLRSDINFGNYQITLGAENITDDYPEKGTGVTCCGADYQVI